MIVSVTRLALRTVVCAWLRFLCSWCVTPLIIMTVLLISSFSVIMKFVTETRPSEQLSS